MSKTHECEYLKDRREIIELVHEGTQWQRWALRKSHDKQAVQLQVVMFCPYCGEDFRADCHWQIPGRPGQNAILRKAREAGERGRADPAHPHPMQPLIIDPQGYIRFKSNGIVVFLLERSKLSGMGLNQLAQRPFSDDDAPETFLPQSLWERLGEDDD